MRFKQVLGFLRARFRELGILDDEAFDNRILFKDDEL